MNIFKVWSEDRSKKKFVVAENYAEPVSKGKRFLFIHLFLKFMAWQNAALADYKYLYI